MNLLKPADVVVKEIKKHFLKTVQLNNFTDVMLNNCFNPVNVYKFFDSI